MLSSLKMISKPRPLANRSFRSRQSRAYTLLEIMIVLGIIAVLLGSSIYYLVGAVGGAKVQRVQGDIATITAALRMYEINNRYLPTTEQGLQALVEKPTTEPLPKRWTQLMSEVPKDPWNRPYAYVCPGKHNANGFDLYSTGEDGAQNGDGFGNW